MSPRGKLTVAITGMNARADNPGPGLAVARCLRESGRSGLKIVGLSYDALDPGLYHPFCDSTYLLPYPSAGQEALRDRLLWIHEQEGFDVLIPCLDAELSSMVALEEELAKVGIRTFLPTEHQLQMRDKSRLSELAATAHVPYPETRPVTHAGFFYTCAQQGWGYPLVVKGPFYDAQIVRDPDDAAHAFRRISAAWGLPILVQRLIRGEEYNLTAIGDGEGHLIGTVMMKKRALTDKGKAWAGICVFDQALQDTADALAKALRWRGPLEVEVMRDLSGRYHLIEINPRFPAWVYLSAGVGRNLPALLLARLMGEDYGALPGPSLGTMFIRYAEEVIVPMEEFQNMMILGASARTEENRRDA
ncbi:MAG TPA: ATP-grasp domain-containing protein [Geothrix sp.]|jgi:carbamoyl-phosphate synthase large subunit